MKVNRSLIRFILAVLFLVSLNIVSLYGGEYIVDQNNPNATDDGPGNKDKPFKTISKAARIAIPGDVVFVREGIYREWVAPVRGGEKDNPIKYIAADKEQIFVKGSELWNAKWKKVSPNVYINEIPKELLEPNFNPFLSGICISSGKKAPEPARPTTKDPMAKTLGQVFVNGKPLMQLDKFKDIFNLPFSWIVEANGEKIYINLPESYGVPEKNIIEISVRRRIFASLRRGMDYIHIEGFIFEHCANPGPFPQVGAIDTRSGSYWTIKNNIIRYAKTIGLSCGSEATSNMSSNFTLIPNTVEADKKLIISKGHHLIVDNIISDNGLCGIAGWHHQYTKIIGNILERNNRLGFTHHVDQNWVEDGAIKLHVCQHVVIENNLIRDNDSHGIWLDTGWYNTRISKNIILNNCKSGIFIEYGAAHPGKKDVKGVTIDNNVIAYTRGGDGIYSHNATDINVINNLIAFNSHDGIYMVLFADAILGYTKKQLENSRHKILNNLIMGNGNAAIGWPYPYERAQNNISDFNIFCDSGQKYRLANKRATFEIHNDAGRSDLDKINNLAKNSRLDKASFNDWKSIMNNDKHSNILDPIRNDFMLGIRSRIGVIDLILLDGFFKTKGIAVDSVNQDIMGNVYTDKIIPGPFQSLKKGQNSIKLNSELFFKSNSLNTK